MKRKHIAMGLAVLGATGFTICGNYLFNNVGLVPYVIGFLAGISGWAFGTGWTLLNLGMEKKVLEKEDEWTL